MDYIKKIAEKCRQCGTFLVLDECFVDFTEQPENVREDGLKQGISIRDCSNYVGLGEGYYRVAVRTKEENKKLLDALDAIQRQSGKEEGLWQKQL